MLSVVLDAMIANLRRDIIDLQVKKRNIEAELIRVQDRLNAATDEQARQAESDKFWMNQPIPTAGDEIKSFDGAQYTKVYDASGFSSPYQLNQKNQEKLRSRS